MDRSRTAIKAFSSMVCLAMIVSTTGCRGYRWGSVMHPQIRTVAIGDFQNRTQNPDLGPLLRKKLAEHLMVDGSLRVTTTDRADVVVNGRIASVKMRRVASRKSRDKDARDRDRDAYQTSIFRVEIQVEFETVAAGQATPLRTAQKALGVAEFSRLPDLEIARQEGLHQATNDAAAKVAAAVTEAW